VKFPDRKLHTARYDLEKTYGGIYQQVVSGVESLNLAPYDLESYKKRKGDINEWEQGRAQALVHIFKCLYLKRFESSVEAFRRSVAWALGFQKTFRSMLLDGSAEGQRCGHTRSQACGPSVLTPTQRPRGVGRHGARD